MKNLRKFIRTVINEDVGSETQVAKLRKWAENNANANEQILLKYDIVPIVKSDDTSFLGSGAFSEVYEVIWKNQHAVAKITKTKSDVEKMQEMNNLGDVYGYEHITKVFDVIEHNDERITKSRFNVSGRSPIVYIVIAEYLVPPPKSLEKEYFYNSDGSLEFDSNNKLIPKDVNNPYEKERSSMFVKDEDIEDVIYDNFAVKNVSLLNNAVLKKLNDEFVEITISGIRKKKNIDVIEKELNKIGLFDRKIISIIITEIMTKISKEKDSRIIPSSFRKYKNSPLSAKRAAGQEFKDPRVESFMKFLLELVDDGITKWSDVRIDNIMMRPKTGEIVISDPGLFYF